MMTDAHHVLAEELQRYIDHGVCTNKFLNAVLAQDLKTLVAVATVEDLLQLNFAVNYLCDRAPVTCWGSPEWRDIWKSHGGLQEFSRTEKQNMLGWVKVKLADECERCDCCDEPFCSEHGDHYADCACVGPTQDGYEYKEVNGQLFARPL